MTRGGARLSGLPSRVLGSSCERDSKHLIFQVMMASTRSMLVTLCVSTALTLVIFAMYRPGRPGSGTYIYQDYTRRGTDWLLPEGQKDVQLNPLTAAMYQRLVVFTAFSSNHSEEALDMIGSVQKYLPHTKIIVYDIGLSTEERGKVAKYCNVELRTFDFAKYPPHVKNIKNYAWRPFMLQELAQEYDVILYGDASLRITGYNIRKALECLLDFPFLAVKPAPQPIIALTHEKQIEYFNFPPSRKYMAHWKTVQATAWFLLVNDLTREKIIAPWVDCVSHEECVAPHGARKGKCNFTLLEHNDGSYVGCHRFIQSALNIILVREFGLEIWDKVVRTDVMDSLGTIFRHPQGIYSVHSHPKCTDVM